MRKFYVITVLAFLFLGNAVAQDVLVVTPGIGTLNAAIATYGGDRIYQLTAGEWYGLDGPIENDNYHLQIIGSDPAQAGGKPATLQTGSDVNGAPFYMMINANGDITLKNIYFVNATLSGTVANDFMLASKDSMRVIIDHCVFHPACVGPCIEAMGGNVKAYFTNNLAIDHGHELSPNDGQFFTFNGSSGIGLDTLFVENNTFVCMGTVLFMGSFAKMVNNVVIFNHNTIVFLKSQLDWSDFKKAEYWTNNLMFDLQTQPYSNSWQPMPGGDVRMPKPNLIYADTLPGETLPTQRHCFVEYNAHYRCQGFYDLVTELNTFAHNKALPGLYLYPLVWPPDTTDCREAQMFANHTDFPNFKYGHTITDVDPQWTDDSIYNHESRFVEWTRPASYIHVLSQSPDNYPSVSEWPQYWWIPSGWLGNNSVWPIFDGTYKNAQILKGSIEKNIPLGDLNWWPEAKAAWEQHKDEIWTHIQAGNEDQIDIGFYPSSVPKIQSESFILYPNPAKDFIKVKSDENVEITIMIVDGRIVKHVKNASQVNISDLCNGLYYVTVKKGNNISTQKVLITR